VPSTVATPYRGLGVVKAVTKPPPIPSAASRPRSLVRIEAEPEPPRAVRSPLVGRKDALVQLQEVVARAIDFQAPQLVSLVGNQGTGKTRLINELIAASREAHPDARVFHGAAERDPTGKLVRFAAVASLLRARFELVPSPDATDKLRFSHEVRAVMASDQIAELLYFLGAFVGLDFPQTPFLRAVSENARAHADLTRAALRRFVELDAGNSPLVLVLDDLQWADDDTIALVNDLANGLAGCPVVIIAAARPEMLVRASGWGEGASDHTRVDLRNLEQPDAETMFRNLLSRCAEIPVDTVDTAVAMTGGNPAFLQQPVPLFSQNGSTAPVGARRSRGGGATCSGRPPCSATVSGFRP